ncbi:MAG: GNAT family N-acetyltransferase [Planctomycetales bacterium]|nr:GNAT family N-acetyltransferase [Planctomycetales bacterium]
MADVVDADPLSPAAIKLLRLAAVEARALYPELFNEASVWPVNTPLRDREAYVLALADGNPIGCGSLRSLDTARAEVRRMFVASHARGSGVGKTLLGELEIRAHRFGYQEIVLETGYKQDRAIRLYEAYGFKQIPPFGAYVGDPVSVCFAKRVAI